MPAPSSLSTSHATVSGARKEEDAFTLDEVMKHRTVTDCWVIIGDGVYDLTAWLESHPGGIGPIMSVAGQDATDHFEAAHMANPKLDAMLRGMRIGSAAKEDILPTKTQVVFRRLRDELERNGFFDCDSPSFRVLGMTWHQREMLRCLSLLAVAVWVTLYAPTEWARALVGGVLMGVFWQQVAFIGHDLGHCSVTGRTLPSPAGKTHKIAGAKWATVSRADTDLKLKWLWGSLINDHTLGLVFGNLLSGVGIGWWKSTHNVHHMVSNSINRDPDIQHLPLLAVSERFLGGYISDFYGIRITWDKFAQAMVQMQQWIFYPLMAVARFNLYVQSLVWTLRTPASTKTVGAKKNFSEGGITLAGMSGSSVVTRWAEVAMSMCFFTWVTALVSTLPTWSHIVTWLLVSHAIAGLLHVQICVSHFAMDMFDGCPTEEDSKASKVLADLHGLKGEKRAQWLEARLQRQSSPFVGEDKATPKDYFEQQLRTTMDVDCPSWMDWLHGGLQFQTVHHLFPHVPRYRLRELSDVLDKYAKECGLTYVKVGFFEANYMMMMRLAQVAEQSAKYPGKSKNYEMLLHAINAEG
jgi:acyl-lipid Delta6-acetylenase / acyl-lipid (9-3)-desaturase